MINYMNVMGRGLSFSPVKIKMITIIAQPSINRTRVTISDTRNRCLFYYAKRILAFLPTKKKARRINGERIIIFCSNEQSCYIDIEYHFINALVSNEIDTIRNPFNWIRK